MLVAGIQFFAVGVLLFEVVLDVNFPGLRSFTESLEVSTLLLLAAYLCGLAVDGAATKVWYYIGRKGPFAFQRGGDSDGEAESWLEVRTDLDRYPQLQNLDTWLVAQQWWWRSRQAAAEASDLRLPLMLGKDSAANAALAWGLSVIALVVVPLRAGSDATTQLSVWALGGAALITGGVLGWSLGSTMIRPEIERPLCRLKRWWLSGVIALVTLVLWGGLRVANADLPEEL